MSGQFDHHCVGVGGTIRSDIRFFFSGSSAGEGWLLGGGVGKLQEATARLPLHRSAALCQDEEDSCGVSLPYLFLSILFQCVKQCSYHRVI